RSQYLRPCENRTADAADIGFGLQSRCVSIVTRKVSITPPAPVTQSCAASCLQAWREHWRAALRFLAVAAASSGFVRQWPDRARSRDAPRHQGRWPQPEQKQIALQPVPGPARDPKQHRAAVLRPLEFPQL